MSTLPADSAGDIATIDVEDFTENDAASSLPNFTDMTFVKFVPVMVTAVPPLAKPLLGARLLIIGALTLIGLWPNRMLTECPSASRVTATSEKPSPLKSAVLSQPG